MSVRMYSLAITTASDGSYTGYTPAIRGLVDFWLAGVEWIVKAGASAFGWVPGIGPKLKEAAKAIEGFRDDVNRSLGGIEDKHIRVNISMAGAREAYAAMGGGGGRWGKSIMGGGKAAGGPVTAGTAYPVGEQGPELFIPGTSGNIVANHKMGGSTTFIVNMPPGSDGEDVVNALKRYERRNGSGWRN